MIEWIKEGKEKKEKAKKTRMNGSKHLFTKQIIIIVSFKYNHMLLLLEKVIIYYVKTIKKNFDKSNITF